jgi:hypothetical protein
MRPPRIGILALPLLLGACRGAAPEPLPVWAPAPNPYVPQQGSGNAFDAYALAALKVEATAGKHLDRVSFYPDQKAAARKACADAVREVFAASRKPAEFHFVPRPPFTPAPYQRGWRLIGRCLRWEVEATAANGDYDRAIDAAIVATRFGFDLTGGGATDASLGFTIVDEARQALVPYLDRMGAGQLGRLNAGLREALARKPKLSVVVDHERESGRLAVQSLQDAAARDDLKTFETNLGPDIKEAAQYLRDLKGEGPEDVRRYFTGYAEEVENESVHLARQAELPAVKRGDVPKPKLAAERPWRRFARHFVGAARPLLEIDDRTTARTRLLAVTATMLQRRKLKQPFPKNLDRLPAGITLDPFSGEPLHYASDGTDFNVYSVGANLRDDGGDTDDAWLAPDLTLEKRG